MVQQILVELPQLARTALLHPTGDEEELVRFMQHQLGTSGDVV